MKYLLIILLFISTCCSGQFDTLEKRVQKLESSRVISYNYYKKARVAKYGGMAYFTMGGLNTYLLYKNDNKKYKYVGVLTGCLVLGCVISYEINMNKFYLRIKHEIQI
jgi:hypothetical protein